MICYVFIFLLRRVYHIHRAFRFIYVCFISFIGFVATALLFFQLLLSFTFYKHYLILFIFLGAALYFFLQKRKIKLPRFFFPSLLTLINGLAFLIFFLPFQGSKKEILSQILKQENVKPIILFKENEQEPTKIVVDSKEKYLYFTTHSGKLKSPYPSVFRINLKNPKEIKTLKGYAAREIILDEKRNRLLVAEHDGYTLLVAKIHPFKVEKRIRIATLLKQRHKGLQMLFTGEKQQPINLLMDEKGNHLLLTTESGYLLSFSLSDLKFQKSISINSSPSSMALDKDEGSIFIGFAPSFLSAPYAMRKVHVTTLKILKSKKAPFWFCYGLALNKKQNELYFTDFLHGKVRIIDAESLNVKKEYFVQKAIREIAWMPGTPYLFVGNLKYGYVYVLNKNTGEILQKIYLGPLIRHIYITKQKRIFVAARYGVFEILKFKSM